MSFEPVRCARFLRFELATRRVDFLLPPLVPLALLVLFRGWEFFMKGAVSGFPASLFSFGLLLGIGSAMNAHRADNETGTASLHVLMPATALEKFAARWALSFGLTYVANFVLLATASLAASALAAATGRGWPADALPSVPVWFGGIAWYLPVHAVFFCGGTFFRGNPFFKTVAAVAAYVLVLGVLVALLLAPIVDTAPAVVMALSFLSGNLEATLPGEGTRVAVSTGRVAWSAILPLFLYLAAYHRTVEHEVR